MSSRPPLLRQTCGSNPTRGQMIFSHLLVGPVVEGPTPVPLEPRGPEGITEAHTCSDILSDMGNVEFQLRKCCYLTFNLSHLAC